MKQISTGILALVLGVGVANGQENAPTPAPVVSSSSVIAADPGNVGAGLYGSADYLLWWFRNDRTPPLATTGSLADAVPGALGQPHTSVLFGGNVDTEDHSGGRFTVGYVLDNDAALAIEGTIFFLGKNSDSFVAGSNGSAGSLLLARPFFDTDFGHENAEILAAPGFRAGSISIREDSSIWGTEADLRAGALDGEGYSLGLLAGFRYLELDEGLDIIATHEPLIFGDTTQINNESFTTHNHFYGGQIGASGTYRIGGLDLQAYGKIALGDNHEDITIRGFLTSTSPFVGTFSGATGLLTQPSNIGTHERDRFEVVPELGMNAGYHITDAIMARIGYTFLYMNDVARPGEQIDRTTTLPVVPPMGPVGLHPAYTGGSQSSFWGQGINFGLEFKF